MDKFLAFGFLILVCFALGAESKKKKGGYGYGYGGSSKDPCDSYEQLSDDDRAAGFKRLTQKSDSKLKRKAWYRFTGEAGDKIASIDTAGECLRSPSCGAKYPGILDTSHPKDLETGKEVKGTICFAKSDKCCYKKKTITIRRCRGFWIYELPRASPKGARYCGNNKGQEKPDCDEKKLLFGLTKKYAAKSCKEIKEKRQDPDSGVYWIKPDGNTPVKAYCDQQTDGGGWTLVYSYTFTNFRGFRSGSNAITPRPTWPISYDSGNVNPSTTVPECETDYNAMDFKYWKNLGHEFMVKSNINHWIACKEGTGSLVEFRAGSLQCRNIKNVASKCHGYVPDKLILHSAGNPAGSTLGPDLVRSSSTSWLKEYYYLESNTRTGNWPTHDPCGTNALNHLTNVANPHGNIYIRE